jgi:hypothetical protein
LHQEEESKTNICHWNNQRHQNKQHKRIFIVLLFNMLDARSGDEFQLKNYEEIKELNI